MGTSIVMHFRWLAMALSAVAFSVSASAQTQDIAAIARSSGTPDIPGLKMVWLAPWGEVSKAHPWRNILAHQTEGPPGSARAAALAQAANPTKRGVTLWVETDGTAYWAISESAIPTHGDGANRNDNKYIDNSKTFHAIVKTNTIGVEFIGNYPDVAKPVTPQQMQAWLRLVPFLQERYGIAAENIYAHNWIDYKDSRYCEGCELASRRGSGGGGSVSDRLRHPAKQPADQAGPSAFCWHFLVQRHAARVKIIEEPDVVRFGDRKILVADEHRVVVEERPDEGHRRRRRAVL